MSLTTLRLNSGSALKSVTSIYSVGACCDECYKASGCVAYTWSGNSYTCYLQKAGYTQGAHTYYISGVLQTPMPR